MAKALIYNGDCLALLKQLSLLRIDVPFIFADPPDNLGLAYDGYIDEILPSAYYEWLEELLIRMYKESEICWLSYYWKHDLTVSETVRYLIDKYHGTSWRKILWRFTFGQHNANDLGSGYRTLLRLTDDSFDIASCMGSIRVESERQRLGDARANSEGRVPDDVWEFPRVVGNAAERRTWHPTQHPQALLERILLSSNRPSKPLKLVLDLFGGTGSMLRACEALQLPCLVIEQSATYCKQMALGQREVTPITTDLDTVISFIWSQLED